MGSPAALLMLGGKPRFGESSHRQEGVYRWLVRLDRTYRMHPAVTEFVSAIAYDDQLRAAPDRDRQTVSGDDALAGAGLR